MIERIIKSCMVFMVPLVVMTGCNWGNKTEGEKPASSASTSKIIVINVLPKELYDDAHIPGSINVPLANLQNAAQTWNKEVPVVVYCSNYQCSASAGGARMLKNLGFKNVSAYEGGMAEWYQLSREDNSYTVEGPAKQEYLSVKIAAPAAPEHADVTTISAQSLRDQLRQ